MAKQDLQRSRQTSSSPYVSYDSSGTAISHRPYVSCDEPNISPIGRWFSVDEHGQLVDDEQHKGSSSTTATIEVVTAIHFIETLRSPLNTPTLMQWPSRREQLPQAITTTSQCPISFADKGTRPGSLHKEPNFRFNKQIDGILKHRRLLSAKALGLQSSHDFTPTSRAEVGGSAAFQAIVQMLRSEEHSDIVY